MPGIPLALGKPREVALIWEVALIRGVVEREWVRRKAAPGKNQFLALPSVTQAQSSWGTSSGYRYGCARGRG